MEILVWAATPLPLPYSPLVFLGTCCPNLPITPPANAQLTSPLRYERALRHQPSSAMLLQPIFTYLAYALIAIGNILVLSSMWALGVTGTYLGDYFGILMNDVVTSFPFNVTAAPMYYGSTLSFLGTAILYGKPAGVLLTAEVLAVYLLALRFEE